MDIKRLNVFDAGSISDLLPYESYDEATQLFYNAASTGFVLKGSPLVGVNLADQNQLADFLRQKDYLPEGSALQVLMFASPYLSPVLEWWKSSKIDDFEKFSRSRIEHLESLTFKSPINLIRNFEVYVSFTVPGIIKTTEAQDHLLKVREALQDCFKSIDFYTAPVSAEELINNLYPILNFEEGKGERGFRWNPHESLSRQLTRPDQAFHVLPDCLKSDRGYEFKTFVPVKSEPYWALGLMDGFIGGLLENQPLNAPFMIHYGLSVAASQGKELMKAAAKRGSLESSMRNRLTRWMPQLKEQAPEAAEVLEELQRGEQIVISGLTVGIWQNPKSHKAEQQFKSLWTRLGWEFVACKYNHLPVFISMLPMTWAWGRSTQLPLIGKFIKPKALGYGQSLLQLKRVKKTLTREAQNMLPIVGEWKGQNVPGIPLVGRRGQLFFWNPYAQAFLPKAANVQTDINYNVCVTGKPGSGKSFFMQEMMNTVLSVGGRVFVLDLGRSFEKSCHIRGGNHIDFNLRSNLSLNPFTHIPVGDSESHLQDQKDMLSTIGSIIGVMAGSRSGLNDLETSYIQEAVFYCWAQKHNQTSITDIRDWLKGHPEQVARDLGQMLFGFSKEGPYGKYFEGPATSSLIGALVVIETEGLSNHESLMAVVVRMMILRINQMMVENGRNIPFAIIIDEAWKMLKGKESGQFIEAATRTARKYKGSIIVGTQNLSDFFKADCPAATDAWNTSTWKCILQQESDVFDALKHHPQLASYVDSEFQLKLLKSIRPHTPYYSEVGLYGGGLRGVVCRLIVDPFARLLYSTNPSEYERINAFRLQGYSVEESVNKVLQEEQNAGKSHAE